MINMKNKMHFPKINGVFNIVEDENNAKWVKCSEQKKELIKKVFAEKMKLNKIDDCTFERIENASIFKLIGKVKKERIYTLYYIRKLIIYKLSKKRIGFCFLSFLYYSLYKKIIDKHIFLCYHVYRN